MIRRTRNSLCSVGCALVLLTSAVSAPAVEIESNQEPDFSAQQITAEHGDLAVTFQPVKTVYQIGEKIQFKFVPNKPVYLYLFSIDQAGNRGSVLLPNPSQTENKYPKPRRFHLVPYTKFTLIANKVGVEHFQMVASTKQQEFDSSNLKAAGKVWIGSADNVEKALRIRPKDQTVSLDIKVLVVPQNNPIPVPQPATQPSMPVANTDENIVGTFIATSRQQYRVNEEIKLVYGADQKGLVTLYLFSPGGKRQVLHQQEVDGNSIYSLTAMAREPIGNHQLIAEYAPSGKSAQSKGLEMLSPTSLNRSQAVYYFEISR